MCILSEYRFLIGLLFQPEPDWPSFRLPAARTGWLSFVANQNKMGWLGDEGSESRQVVFTKKAGLRYLAPRHNLHQACGSGLARAFLSLAPTPRIASGQGLVKPIFRSHFENSAALLELLFSEKEQKMAFFRRCPES